MMFMVVVPGLRYLDDSSRVRLMRIVTPRFGALGGVALAVLVLTGLDNINRYAPDDMYTYRYGYILATKVIVAAAVIAMTVVHSLVIGPRLLREQEAALTGTAGPGLARLRRLSIVLSSLTLLLSLVILLCAALLRGSWAYGTV
jgi:uncharacterized membrane protein